MTDGSNINGSVSQTEPVEYAEVEVVEVAIRDTQTGRFIQGNSGNRSGKPRGAKNKLGEHFLRALQKDFKLWGPETIIRVREEKPQDYLKIIASLLPKDVNLEVNASEEFAQVLDAINTVASHGLAKRISRQRERSADIRGGDTEGNGGALANGSMGGDS